MENHYPHLFSPLTVKKTTYKNRIVCAPMGGVMLEDNHLIPQARNSIIARLSGGAAGFLLGESPVSPESSRGPDFLDYGTAGAQAGIRECVEAIKEKDPGVVALAELMHPGEIQVDNNDKYPVWGPTGHTRADGIAVREFG